MLPRECRCLSDVGNNPIEYAHSLEYLNTNRLADNADNLKRSYVVGLSKNDQQYSFLGHILLFCAQLYNCSAQDIISSSVSCLVGVYLCIAIDDWHITEQYNYRPERSKQLNSNTLHNKAMQWIFDSRYLPLPLTSAIVDYNIHWTVLRDVICCMFLFLMYVR